MESHAACLLLHSLVLRMLTTQGACCSILRTATHRRIEQHALRL